MKTVRTVIIPAAGLGTRFLPVTKVVPKELLPIGATPAIQYVVEEAIAAGINKVVLVTANNKNSILDYFSPTAATVAGHPLMEKLHRLIQGVEFTSIEQSNPRGLGDAVHVGTKRLTEDEYFAVMLPDDILLHPVSNLKLMIDLHQQTGKSVVGLQKVPKSQVSAYGIATVENSRHGVHTIIDLVEKPSTHEAPSDLAVVGRYLLTRKIIKILENLPPGKNNEIQLTDALKKLALSGELLGFELQGERLDVGNPKGLLAANILMSAKEA